RDGLALAIPGAGDAPWLWRGGRVPRAGQRQGGVETCRLASIRVRLAIDHPLLLDRDLSAHRPVVDDARDLLLLGEVQAERRLAGDGVVIDHRHTDIRVFGVETGSVRAALRDELVAGLLRLGNGQIDLRGLFGEGHVEADGAVVAGGERRRQATDP